MGIDIGRLGPDAQAQILRKLAEAKEAERAAAERKYRNRPDCRGALRFDSRKEARRYDELAALERAGAISDLRMQPQFTLREAYTTGEGIRVRAIRYQADFSYWQDGELVVEDVKSRATRTRVYEIKKKLLQDRYGIAIREV